MLDMGVVCQLPHASCQGMSVLVFLSLTVTREMPCMPSGSSYPDELGPLCGSEPDTPLTHAARDSVGSKQQSVDCSREQPMNDPSCQMPQEN